MESEAFLLGIWKSFDELEESINMQELTQIIVSKRKDRHKDHKFMAALKGIKLDGDEDETQKKIEEVKRRAAVKLHGEQEVERQEFADLGFTYQTG